MIPFLKPQLPPIDQRERRYLRRLRVVVFLFVASLGLAIIIWLYFLFGLAL
jgi:hypothetical protein